MTLMQGGILARAITSGALAAWLALTSSAAQAQDKTYVMKITLPTINDAPHVFAKNFAAAVERDSGGRIKAEVFPASQLGSMPRHLRQNFVSEL
jgi:TRAP-type C4-dicarboxylate transport system substrate-binding protein